MSRMEVSVTSIKTNVEDSGNTMQSLGGRLNRTEAMVEEASNIAKEIREQMKKRDSAIEIRT